MSAPAARSRRPARRDGSQPEVIAVRIAMVSERANPLGAMDDAGTRPGAGGADLDDPGGGTDGNSGSGGTGQSRHVYGLARELGRRGHEVRLYTHRPRPGAPDRIPLGPGVTVEHVPAGPDRTAGDRPPAHLPVLGRHLAERWRRDRPDLVHAHFWTSGVAALAAADDLGLPVVQTFHVLGGAEHGPPDTPGPGSLARLRYERGVAERAAALISTSAAERADLLRLGTGPERVHVVPRGVDTGRFHPRGPCFPRGGMRRLLCVGRRLERMGVETLIRALPGIPNTELVVAGGPRRRHRAADPDIRRLRTLAAEVGAGERVVFLGRVPHSHVPALMRSADVVASVPPYAPFGSAPLEAMACGVPVATSPVGGHLDTVVDGLTGIYLPARRPAEVAARLAGLLSDPRRRRALGAAAAQRAHSRFSWPHVVGLTLSAYERAVAANPRSG